MSYEGEQVVNPLHPNWLTFVVSALLWAPIVYCIAGAIWLNELDRHGIYEHPIRSKGWLRLWRLGCYLFWVLVFATPAAAVGMLLFLLGVPAYLIGIAAGWWHRATPEQKKEVGYGLLFMAFVGVLAHLPSHDPINGGVWHPAAGVKHAGDPVSTVAPGTSGAGTPVYTQPQLDL